MHRLKLVLAVMSGLMLLALPTAASAKSRDSDGDRMPDRWERTHDLRVHKHDAKRDADHDGLRNRREFRLGTDPQRGDTDRDGLRDRAEVRSHNDPCDDDTDDDGVEDGDEHAGTVTSFADGVLTITLFDGTAVAGRVTEDTEVECDDDDRGATPAARLSTGDDVMDDEDPFDDDESDDSNDDDPDDDAYEDDSYGDEEDEEEGEDSSCGAEALVEGTVVREADLDVSSEGAVWHEVQLVS